MSALQWNRYKNHLPVVFLLACCSSFAFFWYFRDARHLPYADSMSRLNIARKVVDNLTPGLTQLGSVWLPLPQILMLPFIWNDYLWHSGIAGSIMSMSAFIIGGIYLYKIAYLISKSYISSLLTLAIYALNINVLYLQTTALSESLFMCMLSICIYYFMQWVRTNDWRYLVPAGLGITGLTLTRYEGLPMLFAGIAMVAVYSIIRYHKLQKVERNFLIFSVAACIGFGLWTLYLKAIFGDPLFWMNYYAAPGVETTDTGQVQQVYSQSKPFLAAVWQYFTSVAWMSGIIPTVYALIGLVILTYRTIRDKSWFFLPVLLPASIFLMMALTLQRNTPIVQPSLSIDNILSPETSSQTGFNIRYGLMVFPWVVILCAYLLSIRRWGLRFVMFSLFLIQVVSYVSPKYTAIYQIPFRLHFGKPYSDVVDYMHANYDKGLILISASGFEDQMFQMGYPYKTYIHEGAGKYWKEALDHPARYATWIIIDFNHPSDWLARELKHKQYWSWFYNLVYDSQQAKIYKVKTVPDIDLTGAYAGEKLAKEQFASRFVRQKDGGFVFQDHDMKFSGMNAYDLVYLDPEEVTETVETMTDNGANVVRLWAFGEGFKEGFQLSAGAYNDETFDNLAYVLSVLEAHQIKAIVTLGNFWGDYGGVPKYLSFDGLPNTTPEDWDVFFTHQFTKNRYRMYIEKLLHYKSQYRSGCADEVLREVSDAKSIRLPTVAQDNALCALKDDPTILAWELMNEPRSSTAAKSDIVIEWIKEMSTHIKAMDPYHQVFAGTEGFTDLYNPGGNGPSFAQVAALPNIDAATAHFYAEHNTRDVPLADIIYDWKQQADAAGKPFILEEIGYDKRTEKNRGIGRDEGYRELFDILQKRTVLSEKGQSLPESADVDGLLLWNWALKMDESHGISPLDPDDKELLDMFKGYSQNISR